VELHPPAEVVVDEAPADASDVGWHARLRSYLQRLPLDDSARTALQARAQAQTDAVSAFTALHHGLAGDEATRFADPATASLSARFHLTYGNPCDRHGRPLLSRDAHDRPRLATMPTFHRASMVPRPWSANPLTRAWRWLTGGRFGRRGRLISSGPESQSPDPHGRWRWSGLARRLVLLTLMLGQTAVATYYMTAVLPYHGAYWLEQIILALYAILFAWVSAGFWTAMMGFLTLMMRGDRHAISLTASAAEPMPGDCRTALLMPICNEDVPRVFAGLRATYESVRASDALEHFDFFVLSDSNDADTRVAELDAWQRLCSAVDGFGRIFYRRRTHRIKRKSGNVADWCRRWGSQYRYMVILTPTA
jgi:Membrane glycosyltransferase